MIKIGLTGGLGAGKTSVAKIFEKHNIPIYIADERTKELYNTSDELKKQIIKLLGEKSYIKNGIDKKYIASIIFSDEKKLKALEKIVHPIVYQDFINWATEKQNQNYKTVILESAILFESGGKQFCDVTICVTAPLPERIKRVIKRDNCSQEEVLKRMSKQMDDEKRCSLADFTIPCPDLETAQKQVETILRNLKI